jgi:hypothetical protein
MPPRTDREYASTSFTGLPADLTEIIRAEAAKSGKYLYDIYREAIDDLASHLNALPSNQKYEWPQARPKTGTIPYGARMEVDVVETLHAASAKHGVKKNIFFMAALRDYLRKRGIEVEI